MSERLKKKEKTDERYLHLTNSVSRQKYSMCVNSF